MEKNTLDTNFKSFARKNLNTIAVILVVIVLAIILTVATDGIFLGARNLSNLFRQMSVVTILSSSIFMVILIGGIDLSVGWFMGLLGAITATFMKKMGMDPVAAILLTLAIGAGVGCVHGFLVAYVKVPAFIVTLGGYMVYKGALILVLQGATIAKFPEAYTFFGGAYIPSTLGWVIGAALILIMIAVILRNRRNRSVYNLPLEKKSSTALKIILLIVLIAGFIALMNAYEGIPVPVACMLLVVFIVTMISEKTRYGRFVFSVGGNEEASVYAGINVRKVKFFTFVISGVITAFASVVYTGRLDSATAQAGQNMELDAIAAAVIGGTSLAGGIGKAPMILLGAGLLALIDNGMSLMNISSDLQLIVKGIVLILAVVLDVQSNKNKN